VSLRSEIHELRRQYEEKDDVQKKEQQAQLKVLLREYASY
jgi:hypothetical protein